MVRSINVGQDPIRVDDYREYPDQYKALDATGILCKTCAICRSKFFSKSRELASLDSLKSGTEFRTCSVIKNIVEI